jgi:ActR/RegA family two-component response regulator
LLRQKVMGASGALRVLIVDHDEASRTSAARYLSATGWHVRALERVNDALALLATRAFDAILVDLGLETGEPEGGMRVAEAARATRQSTNIVVLTDHEPGEGERARVMRSANAFLQRPQPMRDVERALRGRPMLR